ncbi:MAG: Gfo/Idh/MocA family oxidoreductase [Planctomycetaceae bacterium]
MARIRQTRRGFLKSSAATVAAGLAAPAVFAGFAPAPNVSRSANERFRIGAIGMRYQGSVIAEKAQAHGDIVAICDVDRQIAEKARAQFGGKADLYEDYRDMLARDDVEIVTIGAPDHWHAAMVVDACRAGKDVYCEKPLTLTVDEGKLLTRVVRETGSVVQVGTWQRSDSRFRLACELVRAGRIGTLKKVTVVLGKNETGGPFPLVSPPAHFNWDLWQGQTPDVPYIKERTHYTFRWWYEYSGGQLTDWGAHHVDIAQWGMGRQTTGPVEIDGRCKLPQVANGYNVAVDFEAHMVYADGVTLDVYDSPRGDYNRNGIMFEGDAGRLFVNRGTVAGKPVEALEQRPLRHEDFVLYSHDNFERPERAGKLDAIINHMGNIFDCVHSRQTPIADVASQHRSATVCHLANISMRLGRKLKWDPERELFVGDAEADTWLAREQRPGFEIKA